MCSFLVALRKWAAAPRRGDRGLKPRTRRKRVDDDSPAASLLQAPGSRIFLSVTPSFRRSYALSKFIYPGSELPEVESRSLSSAGGAYSTFSIHPSSIMIAINALLGAFFRDGTLNLVSYFSDPILGSEPVLTYSA
ncbi:hypothetical protein Mapa_007522 [Marchantia paleacea]|nr:hypothetical protein Mapa_007522 [Marchantia paleacea]